MRVFLGEDKTWERVVAAVRLEENKCNFTFPQFHHWEGFGGDSCLVWFVLLVSLFVCLFVVQTFGLLANFYVVIHCSFYMTSFSYAAGLPSVLCPLPKGNLHFKEHTFKKKRRFGEDYMRYWNAAFRWTCWEVLFTVHCRTEKTNVAKNCLPLPSLHCTFCWRASFQQPELTLTMLLQSLYWNI